jgi:hypothetical protein
MSIATFLTALRDGGPLAVPPDAEPRPHAEPAAVAILETIDFAARAEIAHAAPPLAPAVALWAAERLFRACQFLVYREVGADDVRAGLSVLSPAPASPGTCYSADLVLRYLPDLFSLARGVAREDPLVDGLLALARAWPLSSVGMPDVGDVDASPFMTHPGLRTLYADRILARDDRARLRDPAVAAAVREAIGAFPSLAPAIASAAAAEPTPQPLANIKDVNARHAR